MAFTEQDLKNQQQEIARMAEELSRLNSVFAAQKKACGFAEDEEITISPEEMTPELEKAMAEAKAEAEKEGRARASQIKPADTAASSAPKLGRRGAMRI